ncbi:MAG: hypothetical protein RLZZ612_2058 [Pseudomonadota bacterium]|jgi:type IV pilus assembly protein PilP
MSFSIILRAQCSGIVLGVTLTLVGCGVSDEQDLTEWMQEQRNSFRPKVQSITEPKKFLPNPYRTEAAEDPFNSKKLAEGGGVDLESAEAKNSALIEPELKRRREPLEGFPLDTFAFVGTLEKSKAKIGLLKVNDQLYQVSLGNYLGPNYGKILSISETEISLRELIQETGGEWVEKTTAIPIQENRK